MLRVIVVDDEPPARRLLSRMCNAHEAVEVVGTGASMAEAKTMLETLAPDAAFLDINLGLGQPDGFAVLRADESLRDIVFVTAHANHAVRAFDHGAVDYLLKPVVPERLERAIDRLLARQRNRRTVDPGATEGRVALRVDGAMQFFSPNEIAMLQAEGDYTRVYLARGRDILVSRRLGQLEVEIEHSELVRISRSIIMNRSVIESIRHAAGGKQAVSLSGQAKPVIVGRSAARRLRVWSKN
ncbi:LytR/AlgR family response regulator transcription factor [Roseibium sp. M-1]